MPPSDTATCPGLVELEAFLEGGAVADPAVQRHLEQCTTCRQQADKIRRNNDFLAAVAKVGRKPGKKPATPTAKRPTLTDTVPGYQLLSEIHRGGQGVVYKAVQAATKRRVALKVLAQKHSLSDRQRHRFDREVQVVAGLRHPNIVTVYDSGTTQDGRHFFAMELISGATLDVYLAQTKPALRDTVRLIAKVARAVQYANQRGVIHRDLKPGNVLIDSAGEPHLVDFGVAKFPGSGVAGNLLLSVAGEFIGTLTYASPEQVSDDSEQIDIRTDVYSLGVVLYEALTGRLPYVIAGSITDIVHTITEAKPEPPSRVKAAIDDELETIVLMALAKDRLRRYQSAGELAEDLERYLSDLAISAKRDSTWYILKKTARRYRVHVALAGGFVVFLAVFGVFMAIQRGRAVRAEELAKSRANELARLLSESNIERGRTMIATGNFRGAEELIWREFLTSGDDDIGSVGAPSLPHLGSAQAYWALWELYSRGHCLATLRAHEGGVRSLALNPAGDVLASSGNDASLRLWRMPSREPLAVLRGDSANCVGLTFSPNGRYLLLMSHEGRGPATLWDTEARTRIGNFGERIHCGCFSPDGLTVTTGDTGGAVRVWDLTTQTCQAVVYDGEQEVNGLCFNADGTMLAWTAGQSINVWDGSSIHSQQIPNALGNRITGHPRFDPEQRYLICTQFENVWRWEAPFTGTPSLWLTLATTRVDTVEFSPDGGVLATGGEDSTIKLWDTATSNGLSTLSGHTGRVYSVRFAAGGSLLVSGSVDGTIRFWDLSSSGPKRSLEGHSQTVQSICFSPDGTALASASDDDTLRIWDWRTGRQVKQFLLPEESPVINAVAYSPDGRLLASASDGGNITLWDTVTWKQMRTEYVNKDWTNTVAFSPDGRLVASSGEGKSIKLWALNPWSCLDTLTGHSGKIAKVRFSPDGRTLASCSRDQTIILWDMATRTARASLTDHKKPVRAVAFSPDGKLLASGSDDRDIRLWDSQSGACLATLSGHQQAIYSVAFNPDGRLLASGAGDGEIRLWDMSAHRNVLILQEATGQAVFGVAFSPDGDTLASAGSDRMIHLWDLTYFQRHIAGNLEYQLQEYAAKHGEPANAEALRAWAKETLAKPLSHITSELE